MPSNAFEVANLEMPSKPACPTSKFRQVREGNLNRFYTRYAVGDILVSLLDIAAPHRVLDLGVGEGSLSAAVARRWNEAEIVTVDIDPQAAEKMHEHIASAGCDKHTHHVHDVFNAELSTELRSHGYFDLAICNPPFFRPKWRNEFSSILACADLLQACPSPTDVTAETIFLAQNLKMTRKGSAIAMILPDGILTGWKTKALRRNLLVNHRIDCALQLPRHSFHDTEARCFILFLTKEMTPASEVKLMRYDAELGMLEPIFVTPEQAEQRMDFDFHANSHTNGEQAFTLKQLNADVRRGSISTAEAKSVTHPIFHTSDFPTGVDAELRFGSMPAVDSRIVVAEPGDILMARVDRSLHQKIAIVASGHCALTDCVYRIRVAPEHQRIAFDAMRSAVGRTKILAATKGVGARLIGKADLLNLPFSTTAELSLFAEELF